jgi:hypothetical protein
MVERDCRLGGFKCGGVDLAARPPTRIRLISFVWPASKQPANCAPQSLPTPPTKPQLAARAQPSQREGQGSSPLNSTSFIPR